MVFSQSGLELCAVAADLNQEVAAGGRCGGARQIPNRGTARKMLLADHRFDFDRLASLAFAGEHELHSQKMIGGKVDRECVRGRG